MKLLRYFFLAVAVFSLLFSSCRDQDDIPDISYQAISKKYIQGGWAFVYNDVLWDLTVKGTQLNDIYDFKSKVKKEINESTNCVSIYFPNDTLVYVVRHLPTDQVPYFRQSNYAMNTDSSGFIIKFSNPWVMGFYAPAVYVKTLDFKNELTFYLQYNEVMNLVDSATSFASTIRKEVNNAEVDLYAVRDTLDFYNDLDIYSGIVR